MKRLPCEHCGRSHQTFHRMDACKQKHKTQECACPRYWRVRWTSHSFLHECPLAEGS